MHWDLNIRQATSQDLLVLEEKMPSGDPVLGHDKRLHDQDRGEGVYLVAWSEDCPVGHGFIRWSGFRTAEFAARFPVCPTINSVLVSPPELRGRGIGSALMVALENLAEAAGYELVGLAVESDNYLAISFYQRRGYIDWGGGALSLQSRFTDASGREVVRPEVLTAMTKELTRLSHSKA